ncbi:hypothetical protein [Aeromonas salmonicida]|uniref:hypothetical protein n=1 Tax=Aeromonas salmonicida TaxID=645 RepID=UPI000B5FFF35|nr:hypothetical protein [Aeromonas salmonicida]ARW84222.1 hypothetical protein O23A_p3483 [Aeromonas salmonicida]
MQKMLWVTEAEWAIKGMRLQTPLQNEPIASGRLVLHRVNNLADAAATRATGLRVL